MRIDGRRYDELRPVKITRNFIKYAEGSALIEVGETKVICTATIEEKVPLFLKDQKKGWITAEYAMLPRAALSRKARESTAGRIGGRTHEIQRLIGRSLRAIADLTILGERTIWIDCDVIQADGGTRTAAITGAYIALYDAISYLLLNGIIERSPLKNYLAAVSVGIIKGAVLLDLCYEEDSHADVDMNIVMIETGEFVEIQGTAEVNAFTRNDMERMLSLAEKGILELIQLQKRLLEETV